MLSIRDNFWETVNGGNPDRFVNQYEYLGMISTPFSANLPRPVKGGAPVVDAWGVTRLFPENTPGPFPDHSPDKIVVQDIDEWQDYVKMPRTDYKEEDWWQFQDMAKKIDRKEKLLTVMEAPGIFEQSHNLCEIQNTLIYFYSNPDELKGILDVITEYEFIMAEQVCKYVKPDAIFHHDDWGSQQSTFISPAMFREFIKPCYEKVYGYYKDHGVEVIVHHSDSYAATLVPDMIDMGITVWQGVMRSNNIKECIEKYGEQITFMGGIDSALVDHDGWTEEEIIREVRYACDEYGKYYFIPCTSQGGPGSIYPGVYQRVSEEIDNYSKEVFGK